MPTGRYNLIQLGSIYFTRDGTSTGIPCKTEVAGLPALSLAFTGQTIIAIDGTPYTQTVQPVKGVPISITVSVMEEDVFNSVKGVLNAAIGGSTSLTLNLTDGDFGDFHLTVYPLFPEPIAFPGDFQSGRVKDITLNFTVSTLGYQLLVTAGALTLTGSSVTLTQA